MENKKERVFLSASCEDTEKIAFEFAKELKQGDFIAFFGDLGSGKTAFTRGVAQYLCPEARVTSPTFAIVNEYLGGKIPVFHFDMYRILDDDNLFSTGFYDYFDRDGVLAVEWSENIDGLADNLESVWVVAIEKTGETSREIAIDKIR